MEESPAIPDGFIKIYRVESSLHQNPGCSDPDDCGGQKQQADDDKKTD
jgi:hypothetical protein